MSDVLVTPTNIKLPVPFDDSGDISVYVIKECQNNSDRSSPYYYECIINGELISFFIEHYYADSYLITKEVNSDNLAIRPYYNCYIIKSDAKLLPKQEVFYSLVEAQRTAEMLCKNCPVRKDERLI